MCIVHNHPFLEPTAQTKQAFYQILFFAKDIILTLPLWVFMLGRKNWKAVARPINNNYTFSLFSKHTISCSQKKTKLPKNKSANQTVKEEKKRINENNDFLPAQNTCKMSSLKSDSKKNEKRKKKKNFWCFTIKVFQ